LQKNNENFILKVIKYTPLVFILITSIICTFYISLDYTKDLNKEKIKIKNNYIEFNKNIIQTNIDAVHNYIYKKNNESRHLQKEEIREHVIYAHNMMSTIYNKFKDTKTKEEIILLIKTVLGNIETNSKTAYYFIYDLNGVSIFHPISPEREGKNYYNALDINGNLIVQDSINIAKQNPDGGFQTWMFNRPNEKQNSIQNEQEKIGFIKEFKPYNWFIGSGEYVEDFNKKIKKEIITHIKELRYKDTSDIFILDKKGNFLLSKTKYTNVKQINKNNNFSKLYNDFKYSKNNNTYLEYNYLGSEDYSSEKISYLKKVKIFDWIIGTGFNLNNLDININRKQKELEEDYKEKIFLILSLALIMTLLLLTISLFLSKTLKKRFIEYKENLEKQKEILLLAQEVAHIGDWVLDLKTNKAYWSDEIICILGIDKNNSQNFGSLYFKSMIIDEDKPKYKESLDNCIKTAKEHRCICRIKRPNNEIRWIESRGRLSEDKLSIMGTIQDITDNKELEIEKQEKEEILYQQSKMAAMGEMLNNIAHQWRQPLSTISIAATGTKMQKELGLLADKDLYYALTTINNSVQYLSTTIEDFRDFFNPSNNKLSEFNINDSFNKTLNLVKPQFTAKNIQIIQKIDDFVLSSIENELVQVLINILNNARDALLIKDAECKLIFIKAYIKNNITYIEIKDNAGGINKNIINRIFEPYFTTKHQSQGTGIGLYMSKEIVTKHLGGNILVYNENYIFENTNYSGAKFKISLPLS